MIKLRLKQNQEVWGGGQNNTKAPELPLVLN